MQMKPLNASRLFADVCGSTWDSLCIQEKQKACLHHVRQLRLTVQPVIALKQVQAVDKHLDDALQGF